MKIMIYLLNMTINNVKIVYSRCVHLNRRMGSFLSVRIDRVTMLFRTVRDIGVKNSSGFRFFRDIFSQSVLFIYFLIQLRTISF